MAKEFKVRIGLDGVQQFGSGLRSATQSLSRAVNFVATLGGATVVLNMFSRVASIVRSTAEWADSVRDLAAQFELTTEEVQQLQFAATQGAASFSEIVTAMKQFGRARAQALAGNKEAVERFRAFGLDPQVMRNQTLGQSFLELARKIQNAELSGKQLNAVYRMLGENATPVIGAMKNGLASLAQQARETGAVLRDDVLQRFADISDAIERQQLRNRVFRTAGMAIAMKGLTSVLMNLREVRMARAAIQFLKRKFPGLIPSVGEVEDKILDLAFGPKKGAASVPSVPSVDLGAEAAGAARSKLFEPPPLALGQFASAGLFPTSGAARASQLQSRALALGQQILHEVRQVRAGIDQNTAAVQQAL